MRHPISLRSMVLPVFVLSTACAMVQPEPGAYGSPPSPGSAAAQIRNYVVATWAERRPENLVLGAPRKAHHVKLSLAGGTLDWQGYGVPVTMDIDAQGGRRLLGRRYAALFSGERLVGMVDYPGQANVQSTRACYWDGPAETGSAAIPVALSPAVSPPAAEPVAVVQPVQPKPDKVAVARIQSPVAAAAWAELAQVPAIGTRVYLDSSKAYVGVVTRYEKGHLYTNGLVVPAMEVRYSSGRTDWFSMKVARKIYVVRAGK